MVMNLDRKPNIFDNMNYLLEKYTNNLEALVDERTEQLLEEKKKTGMIHCLILMEPIILIFFLAITCRGPSVRNAPSLRSRSAQEGE